LKFIPDFLINPILYLRLLKYKAALGLCDKMIPPPNTADFCKNVHTISRQNGFVNIRIPPENDKTRHNIL